MIKKQLPLIFSLAISSMSAQEKLLPSTLNEFYNLFYLHSNTTLNQRLGDLKSYGMKNGIWLRSEFVEQITKEDSNLYKSKNQSLLSSLGYDYAFSPSSGKNFLGFNLDYAYSWLEIGDTKGNTHSFGISLYDSFMAHNHFYINSGLKYTMILPSNLLLSDKSLAHLVNVNLEIGQKFIFSSIFFLQPLLQVSVGFIPQLSLSLNQNILKTKNTLPLFLKSGSYMGVDFLGAVRGNFRVGVFFDSDFFFFSSPTLNGISLPERKNYRLKLELSTNIHASKNFRLYLGAQSSFFGESNINYGANLGMRFLFGESASGKLNHPSFSSNRNWQSIQQNLRYEGDASLARVAERTHLSNEQIQEKYTLQAKRNSPNIQDDIKYAKRQRYMRESSRWIDTKKNEENYQNRNTPQMQYRDINMIRDYHKRELERKYGK